MKKLYPYLLIWVFLACLTGCKDDNKEPVKPIETEGPFTEIGKQLCGTYSGYAIIIKGSGVDNYCVNDIQLNLGEIKVANEPTFQITLSTGTGSSSSPEADKYLNSVFEDFGIKTGEPFRIGKAVITDDTFDDGSRCYKISYSKFPEAGNDAYYINIKTDGKKLSLNMMKRDEGSAMHPVLETVYDVEMTMFRDGDSSSSGNNSHFTLNGISYNKLDENSVMITGIEPGMSSLTVPATVNYEDKEYPITRIYLNKQTARGLKELTLKKNFKLTRTEIPDIDKLYIEESLQEWTSRDFYVYQNVVIDYGIDKEVFVCNGIHHAKEVYFQGEYLTDITFGKGFNKIGKGSLYGLYQLRSVNFEGAPEIEEYGINNCLHVEKIYAPSLEYALREQVFGRINYNAEPYIAGEKVTAIVFPDKVGSLKEGTIANANIEYIYIPATSDVYLENMAIDGRNLKGAYVNKEIPPIAEEYWADHEGSQLIGAGIDTRNSTNLCYYLPTKVYEDFLKNSNNPWRDFAALKPGSGFMVTAAPFDYGKDKPPFTIK